MKPLLWGALLVPSLALADGPHIALHSSEGPYTAILFTAPDPLVTGKVDFALLVTRGEAGPGAPVREARVWVKLGQGAPLRAKLENEGGEWSGSAFLKRAGAYDLAVEFEDGRGAPVRLTGTLPVAENHGRRDAVLWSVLLPALAVLLFLANQQAKQQLRAHGST